MPEWARVAASWWMAGIGPAVLTLLLAASFIVWVKVKLLLNNVRGLLAADKAVQADIKTSGDLLIIAVHWAREAELARRAGEPEPPIPPEIEHIIVFDPRFAAPRQTRH